MASDPYDDRGFDSYSGRPRSDRPRSPRGKDRRRDNPPVSIQNYQRGRPRSGEYATQRLVDDTRDYPYSSKRLPSSVRSRSQATRRELVPSRVPPQEPQGVQLVQEYTVVKETYDRAKPPVQRSLPIRSNQPPRGNSYVEAAKGPPRRWSDAPTAEVQYEASGSKPAQRTQFYRYPESYNAQPALQGSVSKQIGREPRQVRPEDTRRPRSPEYRDAPRDRGPSTSPHPFEDHAQPRRGRPAERDEYSEGQAPEPSSTVEAIEAKRQEREREQAYLRDEENRRIRAEIQAQQARDNYRQAPTANQRHYTTAAVERKRDVSANRAGQRAVSREPGKFPAGILVPQSRRAFFPQSSTAAQHTPGEEAKRASARNAYEFVKQNDPRDRDVLKALRRTMYNGLHDLYERYLASEERDSKKAAAANQAFDRIDQQYAASLQGHKWHWDQIRKIMRGPWATAPRRIDNSRTTPEENLRAACSEWNIACQNFEDLIRYWPEIQQLKDIIHDNSMERILLEAKAMKRARRGESGNRSPPPRRLGPRRRVSFNDLDLPLGPK